jgi:transmembrane sensor
MTTRSDHQTESCAALKRQAMEWLAHLSSGRATEADAEALKRWCGQDRAHAEAFAEANLLWNVLGPAAHNVAARTTAPAQANRVWSQPSLGRRAFLGGAAVTAAAAGYLVVRPPLDLWPSASEWLAEHRTATGEQRRIAMADGAAVEMNTQTSLNVGTAVDGAGQIELIAGEAAVTTGENARRPFVVIAAQGRTSATNAKFDVRLDGPTVCVTCLDGTIEVAHGGRTVPVRQKEQVTYGNRGLGQVIGVDPAVVTSWRTGVLIFHREPLIRVVNEINRYRPGRIVLVNAALEQRQIDASFRLDRLDDVIPQVEQVFGARVTRLPGGIVLLG